MNLSGCPLFRGITEERINQLISSGHYQIRTFERETVLVHMGHTCNSLMILVEGTVRGEMTNSEGKSIKIEDISSPHALAPAFLFGKENKYPVTIVANTDVELLVIPRESLLGMMQLEKRFLANYLDVISNRAQFLSSRLNFLSFNSIKGKIAVYLLELERDKGAEFTLSQSQTDLAALFGVARPSLTRAFRELHNQGIIWANGRKIRILDISQLRSLLK